MAEKKGEPYLTEQEAWDLRKFASALNGAMYNVFTPNLMNQNLLNLNQNPETPDYDSIIQALMQGLDSTEKIAAYQNWMEFSDMIFKRTFEYYSNILSFDLTITAKPKATNTEVDYSSDYYKKDLKRVHDFLDTFDYQSEFKRVLRQVLRNEVNYTWLRNNGNPKNPQYTLQTLPQSK